MERVNQIWRHPMYQECLKKIEELEEKRPFCRHDPAHFLAVARLAHIENLEQRLQIPVEWLYACALLHDIGRHEQYLAGIPHQEASVRLAAPILKDCGFEEEERQAILEAIESHRNAKLRTKPGFAGAIYRADKASRACFACGMQELCDWPVEKKNLTLQR